MSLKNNRVGAIVLAAAAAVLGVADLAAPAIVLAHGKSKAAPGSIKSVEFNGMDAPTAIEQRATTYSEATVTVTYRGDHGRDGRYGKGHSETFSLSYRELDNTLSTFNGVTVGDLYDQFGNVLLDPAGQPQRSETPDANSLIEVRGAKSDDPKKRRLFLVTHYEYDWIDTLGNDNYGRQPMTMSLATIDQDKKTGKMTVIEVKNIDMSPIKGLWIPCAGSLSPWNTHLGSEEYEPDARCAENPDALCASSSTDPAQQVTFNDYYLNLDSMNRYLDPTGNTKPARAYDYGIVPEVTVDRYGNAAVERHRALGRVSRELVQVMPDWRTVYQGDDGTYNVMTMFVADIPGNLSSGTLYAAKWIQTSPDTEDGGSANLKWIRLGRSSDRVLDRIVDDSLQFSDIFEVKDTTDKATCEADPGYKLIKAGHSVGLVECLKLKETGSWQDDMQTRQAAAFLETRRYAAYVGATVEFEKFEGVTVNETDNKLYLALTRMRNGMQASATDPVDDIHIPRNDAGAVYEVDLGGWQTDSDDQLIRSRYVGSAMRALVVGAKLPAVDDVGNTADVDKIASPDNLKYSENMRTLFIGEDSSLHVNNFLWAYSIDTGKLSRILSIPAGAESTGLQAVDDANGFSYIMSNYQHAGDFTSTTTDEIKDGLSEPGCEMADTCIDPYKASIGYIEGLPKLK
ncbi:MAG: alkaline phosphatase PhoX [Polyangiales bacterium]